MDVAGVRVIADGDLALVERARRGDHEAFAALIRPRADRALRTARAIVGDEATAHDATQNALISAWVHLPKLKDPAKPASAR
jgi:RNA polymerase sigma-70 factor (ECF subfamily)